MSEKLKITQLLKLKKMTVILQWKCYSIAEKKS